MTADAMTMAAFTESLAGAAPPTGLTPALAALWWAGKGDWDQAHRCAQAEEGSAACDRVHAYLHRQEGDLANARYWYRRAAQPFPTMTLPQEWSATLQALLATP